MTNGLTVLLFCDIHIDIGNITGLGAFTFYLEKHELLCLYSSLDIASHTGGVYIQSASSKLYSAEDF